MSEQQERKQVERSEQDENAGEDLEVNEDAATEVKGGDISLNYTQITKEYQQQK